MNLIHCAGKLSIAQEHFNLLTRMHAHRAGREALRPGIATDTVATPQDSQRAQRVQGTAQTIELLSVQRETRPHGRVQPVL